MQFESDPALTAGRFMAGTGLELGLLDVAWLDLRLGPEGRQIADGWRWRLALRCEVRAGTVGKLKLD